MSPFTGHNLLSYNITYYFPFVHKKRMNFWETKYSQMRMHPEIWKGLRFPLFAPLATPTMLNAEGRMQNKGVAYGDWLKSFPQEIPQFCIHHSALCISRISARNSRAPLKTLFCDWDGPFVPTMRFKKPPIHKVFRTFWNVCWNKIPRPNHQNRVFRGALQFIELFCVDI